MPPRLACKKVPCGEGGGAEGSVCRSGPKREEVMIKIENSAGMQHAKKEDPRRERIRLVNVAEEKIRLNLHHWNPLGKRSSGNISMFVSSNSRTAAHCKHCTRCLSDGVPSANVFSPPPTFFLRHKRFPNNGRGGGKDFSCLDFGKCTLALCVSRI